MKIVLVFSEIYLYEPGVIYVVSKKNESIPESAQNIVVAYDVDDIILRDEADKFREHVCNFLSDDIVKDSFKSNFHNFYFHIFRNTYKWIKKINHLIEKHPKCFFEITDYLYSNYMPLYEAEGEINKTLFYNSYDFIPKLIIQYLDQKSISYTISKNHSKINLNIRVFLRRYLVLFAKPIFASIQLLKYKKSNYFLSGEEQILLLSRSIVHSHMFYPFINKTNKFFFLYGEGFFTKGINSNFFLNRPKLGVSIIEFSSLQMIWSIFFLLLKKLLFNHKVVPDSFVLLDIKIPFKSLLIEMIISYYDALLFTSSLENFLKLNPKFKLIITAETFTQYPYSIRKLLNKTNAHKFIQVSNGVLDIVPNVKFIFGDYFAITSKSVFEDYQNLHSSEKNKMVFWGDTKYIAEEVEIRKSVKTIIYFSQPYDYQIQESIYSFLFEKASKNNIRIKLKLHPRDNQSENLAIKYNFQIQEITSPFIDYIKDADLAISRNSSILKDIILSGIPFVSILYSENDRRTINEFINPFIFNKFRNIFAFSELDLENYINNIENHSHECNKFLEYYKKENINNCDSFSFLSQLNQLVN